MASRASCSIIHHFSHELLVLFLALFNASFHFLNVLSILTHFGAVFFLLTPQDDLDWKTNDLEKAISLLSESEFGDCDLGMLLVPNDASNGTI